MPLNYRYALTDEKLFQMVDYFENRDYKFISAKSLAGQLDPDEKYVSITFDDGYANNIEAISRLWERKIPSTLFATTHNIESGESFWWDTLYRARAQNNSIETILAEESMLNELNHDQIKDYFSSVFSSSDFNPKSEFDRPISPRELKVLQESTNLSIANHTHLHQNLTCLAEEEVYEEISTSHKLLEKWDLSPIRQVAYPGGMSNNSIREQLKKESFDLGYTDRYLRNAIGGGGTIVYPLQIGRYIISCRRDVLQQCQLADARYSLLKSYSIIKNPLD